MHFKAEKYPQGAIVFIIFCLLLCCLFVLQCLIVPTRTYFQSILSSLLSVKNSSKNNFYYPARCLHMKRNCFHYLLHWAIRGRRGVNRRFSQRSRSRYQTRVK